MYITLGQLDVLLLIGLLARPPFDVLLLAIKPHVLGTAVLFRLREYRARDVGYLLAAVALSLVIWQGWPILMIDNWQAGVYHPLSLDIFPYGLPIGVFFLAWAWRRQNVIVGGISSFFLVPYISPGSVFVYAVLVFSTFTAVNRLAIYLSLWALALVLLA
jgi:hypothetical protein